jgi:hypothetical protein
MHLLPEFLSDWPPDWAIHAVGVVVAVALAGVPLWFAVLMETEAGQED